MHRKTLVFVILFVALLVGVNVPPLHGSANAIPSAFYLPNTIPFGATAGNGVYQQVYDATLFPGKIIIYGVGFVPGAEFALPGFLAGDYKISFSITSKTVCGLDGTNLASNVGSRRQVFFSGKLDGGVSIFGLPYIYDPAQGNLLMTVEVTGKPLPNTDSFQGAMWRGNQCQGASRAYNFPQQPSSGADGVGLVTIFTYVPVFTFTNLNHGVPQMVPSATTPLLTPAGTALGDIRSSPLITPE